MFNCHVCGHSAAKSELVSEVFNLGGRRVLVELIPALVCTYCEEATFSRETTEHIHRMVHGVGQPGKTVPWKSSPWREVNWSSELAAASLCF